MRQNGGVGGHDDDDRPLLLLVIRTTRRCPVVATPRARSNRLISIRHTSRQIRNLLANWDAGDAKIAARAIVTLDEHADCIAAIARVELPRRSADSSLEAMTHHSSSTADIPLGDWTAARAVERREHV